MSFPRDAYPYTNFHELNLGYFITHFREIFSQWADLYDQMTKWKDATDEELATWKAGVEADLDQREAALRAELETWKAQTGQDIAGWEDATLAALTAWQTATQAVFEAIRVEAAGSATAAAASATDAATAKTAAETAQAAAEAAAASVTASAAQIATNTADISDLKTQLNNSIKVDSTNIYNNVLSNGSVSVVTGDFAPGNTAKCTDMLPVIPGKYLVSAYNNARLEIFTIALFDANETIIPETVQRTGDGTQRATGYILIPDNCAFVRVTYVNANAHAENKLYLLDEVDYNPSNLYIKYLILNNGDLLPFNDIVKKSELDNISNIVDELEGKINDSIYYQSNNIYNNVLSNGSVSAVTGDFAPGNTAKCTDMLPVIPGKYLVSAYNNARLEIFTIALFDANETIIPETVQRTGDSTQRATGYILIPDNCAFVRVTYVNANAHAENKLYLLDEVDYNPSNLYIKSLLLDNGDVLPFADIVSSARLERSISSSFTVSHKYYKQKLVAMGDSITNGQSWFDGAAAYFGIRPINKGVPGSMVSTNGGRTDGFCTDARVNDIPADTKLLLIMGGVNDWGANVPLGDKKVNNIDTTTFYGAVNVLIQKLYARIPDAKIICMGATFGVYANRPTMEDQTGIYNNLGLCSLDYGKAFAEMCELNGVESFVIGYECGWNKDNISTYVDFDGAYLHPNALGGAKMAEVIAKHVN